MMIAVPLAIAATVACLLGGIGWPLALLLGGAILYAGWASRGLTD